MSYQSESLLFRQDNNLTPDMMVKMLILLQNDKPHRPPLLSFTPSLPNSTLSSHAAHLLSLAEFILDICADSSESDAFWIFSKMVMRLGIPLTITTTATMSSLSSSRLSRRVDAALDKQHNFIDSHVAALGKLLGSHDASLLEYFQHQSIDLVDISSA